jgi:formimidoylglutamate deiminase
VALDAVGRIAAVEAGAAARTGDRVLTERALLPAPANLHGHAFQRGLAGLAERPGAGPDSFWTWREAMYAFLARLTPEDVAAIAAMVQVEMAEAGFAAVGEFHYLHHAPDGTAYADRAAMSAAIGEAAATTGLGLTHLPVLYTRGGVDDRPVEGGQRRFACDLDGFARLLDEIEVALAHLPGDTRVGVAPHSLRAVRADEVTALVALRPGAPFHIHAAEQVREVAEVEAALGARPVRWLLDHQPVDPSWCVIHATHTTADETQALAASGAVAGLCPLTEANLGDGVFDGARHLAAGGRFGVGSDSHVRIALAEEVRQLEGSQRLRDRARNVLAAPPRSTGRTLFDALCAGGAQALGRDAGRIAVGRWADLATLDLAQPTLAGLDGDRLLDGWLLAGDDRLVREVWSAGRPIVADGRHPRREPVARRFAEVVAPLRSGL